MFTGVQSFISNNMEEDLDWQKTDYTSSFKENETFYLPQNDSVIRDIVPLSLTSAIFFSAPPKSKTYNSTDSREEFQFYIIGIYSFFAVVFGFGIILILFKKFQKACCDSETDCPDYASVPNRESLSPQDNLGFENHVNVNFVDIEGRNNGHDSDYEYYSDEGEKDYPKDKPPAYEEPPSYSILLQK